MKTIQEINKNNNKCATSDAKTPNTRAVGLLLFVSGRYHRIRYTNYDVKHKLVF